LATAAIRIERNVLIQRFTHRNEIEFVAIGLKANLSMLLESHEVFRAEAIEKRGDKRGAGFLGIKVDEGLEFVHAPSCRNATGAAIARPPPFFWVKTAGSRWLCDRGLKAGQQIDNRPRARASVGASNGGE